MICSTTASTARSGLTARKRSICARWVWTAAMCYARNGPSPARLHTDRWSVYRTARPSGSPIRSSMNALVKLHAEPGLWLADVPEPECGINDVLIRVLRTGICGTDLHIRNWDAWASRTIPVPMVIGHEFVGEVVSVGSNVPDFHPGEVVSRRGPCRLRPLPQLHGRPPPPVRAHVGGRRQPAGRVRRADRPADDEHLAPPRRDRPRRRVDLRPVRQRGAHRAAVPGAGRGRADHRRRADRLHGDRRRPPRRRPVRRRLRPQPGAARAGRAAGCDRDVRPARDERRADPGRARHGRGLRRRPGDVGQRCGAASRW